jgi:hypothetical protein
MTSDDIFRVVVVIVFVFNEVRFNLIIKLIKELQ